MGEQQQAAAEIAIGNARLRETRFGRHPGQFLRADEAPRGPRFPGQHGTEARTCLVEGGYPGPAGHGEEPAIRIRDPVGGHLVLLQENRREWRVRQAISPDQRSGHGAPKGRDPRQKSRERLAPQGGLRDGQNVVFPGRSGHGGDHHLARRPGAAVAVLDHADVLASATPLLDAHAPVNMPTIISKEGQNGRRQMSRRDRLLRRLRVPSRSRQCGG